MADASAFTFTCQSCRARLTHVGNTDGLVYNESAWPGSGRGPLQASVFDHTNVDESFIVLDGKRQGECTSAVLTFACQILRGKCRKLASRVGARRPSGGPPRQALPAVSQHPQPSTFGALVRMNTVAQRLSALDLCPPRERHCPAGGGFSPTPFSIRIATAPSQHPFCSTACQ